MKRVGIVLKSLLVLLFSVSIINSTLLDISALNATLVWGEEIYYPSYLGNWSTKKCYINGSLAYCLQASKNTPPEGQYASAVISNNEALLKVLYYGYGGPEDVFKNDLAGTPEKDKYLYTHVMASYAYSGDIYGGKNWDDLEAAGIGLKARWLDIQSKPVPYTEFSLDGQSDLRLNAYYENGKQRTADIIFHSPSSVSITIPLPEGMLLHNVSQGIVYSDSAKVYGTNKFYLETTLNKTGVYNSGNLFGNNLLRYAPLVIQTANNFQDEGTITTVNDDRTLKLSVNWISGSSLAINKKDNFGEKINNAGFNLLQWNKTSNAYEQLSMLTFNDVAGLYETGFLQATDLNGGRFKIEEIVPPGYTTLSRYEQEFSLGDYLEKKVINTSIDGKKVVVKISSQIADDHMMRYEVINAPPEVNMIQFPTWSDSGGQDDISWIDLHKDGDGIWRADKKLLEDGQYTIHGYYKTASEMVNFFGTEIDATKIIIDAVNNRIMGQVKIHKYDEVTGRNLANIEFEIIAKDDIISPQGTLIAGKGTVMDSIATDQKGNAQSNLLNLGNYTLKEVNAPEGYLNVTQDFSLTAENTDVEIVEKKLEIANSPNHIYLIKTDEDSGKRLNGAQFALYAHDQVDSLIGNYTTDENGMIDISKLLPDDYYFIEIKAPDGYQLIQEKLFFTVKTDGTIASLNNSVVITDEHGNGTIVVTNKKSLPLSNLRVTKKNDLGKTLANAQFALYSDSACTKLVKEAVTKSDGIVEFNDLSGDYYLKEVKAPEGYRLLKEPIKVSLLWEDNKYIFLINDQLVDNIENTLTIENGIYTGNLTIINNRQAPLPATGSMTTVVLISVGTGICVLTIFKEIKMRRKEKMNLRKMGITTLVCALSLSTAVVLENTSNIGFSNSIVTKVNAAEMGHITINANDESQSLVGKKFNVYKIFDAQNAVNSESINYTMNLVFEEALKAVTGKTTEYEIIDYIQTMNNNLVVNDVTHHQQEESRYSNLRYFIENLRNEIVTEGIAPTQTVTVPEGSDESFTFDVPYGWYIVDEVTSVTGTHSAASLCMVNTANPDVAIDIKSDFPVVQKQIREDDNRDLIGSDKDGWNDVGDYEIGQTVPYRYLTKVPNMNGYDTYYFAFHDKMDNALTFDKDSIVVKIGDHTLVKDTDYKVVSEGLPDGETFQIQITDLKATVNKYYYANQEGAVPETEKEYGQDIVVEYNAILNDNAQNDTGRPGFENDVKLEFSNNPDSDGKGETGETPWDTVVAFTFRIDGVKVNDQTPELKLEGAKFRLYLDETCTDEVYVKKSDIGYTVINDDSTNGNIPDEAVEMVSDANGLFNIVGLDSQTYYLKETKAPDGYRLLKDPIKIDVKATYNETNRDSYVKGDGATEKTLQKLEAGAHFKEFYTGDYKEYDNNLVTDIETGTINIKVVNKVGSKLPATGSAMTLALVIAGSATMIAVLIKRRTEKE